MSRGFKRMNQDVSVNDIWNQAQEVQFGIKSTSKPNKDNDELADDLEDEETHHLEDDAHIKEEDSKGEYQFTDSDNDQGQDEPS